VCVCVCVLRSVVEWGGRVALAGKRQAQGSQHTRVGSSVERMRRGAEGGRRGFGVRRWRGAWRSQVSLHNCKPSVRSGRRHNQQERPVN